MAIIRSRRVGPRESYEALEDPATASLFAERNYRVPLAGLDGIVTPGEILGRANLVNAAVDGLDADVQAAAEGGYNSGAWDAFRNGWKSYFSGLQGVSGWLSRLWGGAMDQVEQYERQVNEWRAKLKTVIAVSGPEPAKPNESVLPSLKTLLYAGGALFALTLLPQVLGAVKSFSVARKAAGFGYLSNRRRRRRG